MARHARRGAMSDPTGVTPRVRRYWAAGLLAAGAVLIVDQAIKLWLLFVFEIGKRGAVRLTAFFDLVLAWNTGISYGWFQSDGPLGQWLLLAVKTFAVAALVIWLRNAGTRLTAIALGLIIGGALGNAIDRLLHGAVVDFALFHLQIGDQNFNWYVFNFADAAIVAGVVALLYESVFGPTAAKAP
jgi:signal peptidase II